MSIPGGASAFASEHSTVPVGTEPAGTELAGLDTPGNDSTSPLFLQSVKALSSLMTVAFSGAVSNAICVAKALSAGAALAQGVGTGEASKVGPGEAPGVRPGEAPRPTGATEGFDGATAAANAATKADAVSAGVKAGTGVAARVGPGVAAIIGPGEAETGAGVGGAGRGSKLRGRQAPVAAVTPDTTVCGVGCAKSDGKELANAACLRSSSVS